MRRKDREITDFSSMLEIVKSCDCCRLGLVDGKEAYIVPMNFGFDGEDGQLKLYFHCANEGRKLELLPSQSVVSFEMDTKHQLTGGEKGCDFSYLFQCVMGTGDADVLTSREEKIFGLQKIMAHYTGRDNWDFDEKLLEITTVLRLQVKAWSCKEH